MSYPVGDGSKANFDKNWYVALGFGDPQSYGFHEGLDININTGGDSDLGQPLRAIADGEIVYYHKKHPESGFGYHFCLKVETPRGTRWVHYAHCMLENFPAPGPVKEGQVIAKLGESGRPRNELPAHVHFASFKVDPATLPQGIDTIAKTKAQLDEIWENPDLLFTNQAGGQPMANMYKGLDLSNAESMKIAVDAWADLRDGKLIKKEVADQKAADEYARGKNDGKSDGYNEGKAAGDAEGYARAHSEAHGELDKEYARGFEDGKAAAGAGGAPTEPAGDDQFVINGKTVETTEGNVKTILNYRVK